jgi:hypothetical protein
LADYAESGKARMDTFTLRPAKSSDLAMFFFVYAAALDWNRRLLEGQC